MNTKQDTQATARHTPGEWKINETWGTIESQDGKEICAIHASDESGRRLSKSEAQANARLIASAPSLLAALEALVKASCAIEEAKSTATDDALTCLEGKLETATSQACMVLARAKAAGNIRDEQREQTK